MTFRRLRFSTGASLSLKDDFATPFATPFGKCDTSVGRFGMADIADWKEELRYAQRELMRNLTLEFQALFKIYAQGVYDIQ